MKRKKKTKHKHRQRIQLSPLQPKGKLIVSANAKRIHLTGGGWAA